MNTHIHVLEAYTALYKVWKDNGLREAPCKSNRLDNNQAVQPTNTSPDIVL